MKRNSILMFCLFLMAINFGLQSFDLIHFRLNPCGYYVFDPSCMEVSGFVVNKILRLILNLLCLGMLLHSYSPINLKQITLAAIALLFLIALDFICVFNGNDFLLSVHKILNPVLYSPLLAIAFLGTKFLGKNKP